MLEAIQRGVQGPDRTWLAGGPLDFLANRGAVRLVAETRTEDDELAVHRCDLDATRFGKETIFDFKRHRRIEHYGRITSQTGVTLPPEA